MRRCLLLAVASVVAVGVAAPADASGRRAPAAVSWLGPSYKGLPLVHRSNFPPSFFYERCGPRAPATCEVQVQNRLLRSNHPSTYPKEFECVRLTIRGVPAYYHGDGLDVYTGRRTVRIFGANLRHAVRAARALRVFPRTHVHSRALPRPAIPVQAALRRCRAASVPLAG